MSVIIEELDEIIKLAKCREEISLNHLFDLINFGNLSLSEREFIQEKLKILISILNEEKLHLKDQLEEYYKKHNAYKSYIKRSIH